MVSHSWCSRKERETDRDIKMSLKTKFSPHQRQLIMKVIFTPDFPMVLERKVTQLS